MMDLYGHPFSSYTWKAEIALIANGTAYQFCMVDQDHPENAAFVQQAHPAGKFPVLRDGDAAIIEATAIIEYLAVCHPGAASLMPADSAAATTVRMLDRVFDNYVMTNMQRVVAAYITDATNPDQAEIASAREALLRAYHWLERWLTAHAFPAPVNLATCAAAPSLFYADWVEPIPAACPRLAALRAELLALPAVAQCVEAARPYRGYFPPGAPQRDRPRPSFLYCSCTGFCRRLQNGRLYLLLQSDEPGDDRPLGLA